MHQKSLPASLSCLPDRLQTETMLNGTAKGVKFLAESVIIKEYYILNGADFMSIDQYIEKELLEKFEFYNYNHALEIITQAFPEEWKEVCDCLRRLQISVEDLRQAGGNETQIPKKFDDVLYPYGWREIRITGDMHIKMFPRRANQRGRFENDPADENIIEGYIDGHNIDFLKNRIAFDLEWNSKDQTFDRDLLAMRTYYDCDIVSAGIIITRAKELNDVFSTVFDYDKNSQEWRPIMRKYGASTTWAGKLLSRLDSRRNGGCPVLAVGIKKKCISDWNEGYIDEHNPENNR